MRWAQPCLCVLRRNGMDKLVDGYRVDVYLSGDLHRFASTRTDDLEQDAFALRTAAKSWPIPGLGCRKAYTLDRATIRQNRATNASGLRAQGDVILLLDMLVFKNYFCRALCLEPFTSGEVMC
jgi:hypothetical protein